MAVTEVGSATPWSTGTTSLTTTHDLVITCTDGDFQEGDVVVVFVGSWFASAFDSTQYAPDFTIWDAHDVSPFTWNDSLAYSYVVYRVLQAGDVGPTYTFTLDGSSVNWRGILFATAFRGITSVSHIHGPFWYNDATPDGTDANTQWDPDIAYWTNTPAASETVVLPDHNDGVASTDGTMLVIYTVGWVGGAAGVMGTVTSWPAGATEIDQSYDTLSTSGSGRKEQYGWAWEVITSASEGTKSFTASGPTGTGSLGMAVDRYVMDFNGVAPETPASWPSPYEPISRKVDIRELPHEVSSPMFEDL